MPEPVHTYIGVCCREWILAYGARGRCGICGTTPVFIRDNGLIPTPERETSK